RTIPLPFPMSSMLLLPLLPRSFLPPPAPPAPHPLSLHDALPICAARPVARREPSARAARPLRRDGFPLRARSRTASVVPGRFFRSEEHTSELQSRFDLVCRLLL